MFPITNRWSQWLLLVLSLVAPISIKLHAQGVSYLDTIEMFGEKYDVFRVTDSQGWGFTFNALNNRQKFTTEFGTSFIATAVGEVINNAGGFSNGGPFLMISSQDRQSGEFSQAEDINDSGVAIGWRRLAGEAPRAFIYSKEGIQYLDELFPAVKTLADMKTNPNDPDPVGTKGFRITDSGNLFIEGITTGNGTDSTSHYVVDPGGTVTPFFSSESNRVPDAHGRGPNKDGWFGEYPGIIHDDSGNGWDIREIIHDQLSDSEFISEWPITGGSQPLINNQRDITWGNLVFQPACPDPSITFTADGFEFVDGKLTAFVGQTIKVNYTLRNRGRGPLKNVTIREEPSTDVLRIISGPTPSIPNPLQPDQVFEAEFLWRVEQTGTYTGAFVVSGEGGPCGIVEASVNTIFSQYIQPDLGVRLTAYPPEVEESESILLRIDVTNNSDETVTDIELEEDTSALGTGETVLVEGPVPAMIESLGPGQNAPFILNFKADFPGRLNFQAQVKGQKPGGEITVSPVGMSGEVKIVPPVNISIRAKPLIGQGESAVPIVNMKVNEEGNITDEDGNIIQPKVEVTIQNNGEKELNLLLQAITPFARDRSPLVDRIHVFQGTDPDQAPDQEFAFDMGMLGPGESKSVEYPLIIEEDGRFDFRAFATGTYTGRSGQFNLIVQDAPVAVNQAHPLEIELELSDPLNQIIQVGKGAHKVQPGGTITVLGTLRNRTSNQIVRVKALDAVSLLNAFGGVITDQVKAGGNPIPGGDVLPPFTIDHYLDPAESVILKGIILTDTDGAPTGTVTWELPDDSILIDIATEEERELKKEDILFKTDVGGWNNDKLIARFIQDNSKPPLPPIEWWEPAAHFYQGTMYGIGSWTYNSFDTLASIGSAAGSVSLHVDSVEELVALSGQAGLAVFHAGEYMFNTLQEMSQEDLEQFSLVIAEEVQKRALLISKQLIPIDRNDLQNLNKVYEYVLTQTLPLFGDVEKAYASDNPREIADLWGRVNGNLVAEVATAFVPTPRFSRYADASELGRLAKNADNVRAPGGQEAYLRGMKSGPVDDVVAKKGWGGVGREVEEAQKLMSEMGIRGYLRERAAKSVDLIKFKLAVAKPGSMKPKGINDLDLWILGDQHKQLTLKGTPGGSENINLEAITAIFRPDEDAVIRAKMLGAGQNDEKIISAVLERAKSRRKEWEKHRKEFDQLRKDGLDVDFNYRDNDTIPPNPGDPPGPNRDFDYEVVPNENGPDILIPKMANEDGILSYITGDIDWVHFSFLDGTPLDSETASRFYTLMNRCCQLQHGETIAWMNDGQTIFKTKANQLKDYISGAKALLEVSADGKRAVRIQEGLSWFSGTGRQNIIYFDNAVKSTALEALRSKAEIQAKIVRLFERYPPRAGIFLNWFDRVGEIDWTVTGGPDAEVIRESENGGFEKFDGSAWTSWTPPAEVSAKGLDILDHSDVHLTPMTSLDEGTFPEEIELEFVPLNELWAEEFGDRLESWFTEGDVIVFDPGSEVQEIRKIVSLDPVQLDWPLDFHHSDATLVAVLPANLYEPSDRQEQVEVIQIIHNENDETLRLATRIPYRAQAHLEISTDMETWQPLAPLSVQGGLFADATLMVTYPGETTELTVDIQNLDTLEKLFIRLRDPGEI